MTTLFALSAIADIYADAYLADESGNLIFLSVWGRDTAIQELVARLQLPRSENGIREFSLTSKSKNAFVRVPNVNDLEKTATKTGNTILGELTQLWIYDKLTVQSDIVNRRGMILYNPDLELVDPWPLLKSVSSVPMIDTWKEIILEKCKQKGWIKFLLNGVGISGILIELDDGLELTMTEMIQRGELTLPFKR